MDALAIAAVFAGITGIITACFTGYIAIKSLPQVHALVDGRSSKQDAKIDELEALIRHQSDTALAKSEAREATPAGPTGEIPVATRTERKQ